MRLSLNKLPILLAVAAGTALAQAPPQLTLQQAVAIAIQNHPQIQAAQNEANFAHQQIVINRSAYYPTVNGEITGSQGNDLARIGAGELSASMIILRASGPGRDLQSDWSPIPDARRTWWRARV